MNRRLIFIAFIVALIVMAVTAAAVLAGGGRDGGSMNGGSMNGGSMNNNNTGPEEPVCDPVLDPNCDSSGGTNAENVHLSVNAGLNELVGWAPGVQGTLFGLIGVAEGRGFNLDHVMFITSEVELLTDCLNNGGNLDGSDNHPPIGTTVSSDLKLIDASTLDDKGKIKEELSAHVIDLVGALAPANADPVGLGGCPSPNHQVVVTNIRYLNATIFLLAFQDEDGDGQPDLDEDGNPIPLTNKDGVELIKKAVFNCAEGGHVSLASVPASVSENLNTIQCGDPVITNVPKN